MDEVVAALREMGEYLLNGEGKDERAPRWETLRGMAEQIADTVVGAENVNIRGDLFEAYQTVLGKTCTLIRRL